MYLRTTQRKNKDGSVVRYVQLAHNEWDSERGRSVARIAYNFGREDELDVDALKRLVSSIQRYLGPEEMLAAQTADGDLNFVSCRPLGGVWVLDRLWHELEIPTTLNQLADQRSFRSSMERAIFAMVANRALDPSSKRSVEEWVQEDTVIPGADSLPVHQLYRAMDFLVSCESQIQEAVFWSAANLLNLEVDLLFFDTTSTYFEVEDADVPPKDDEDEAYVLRRYGHSKDHRPDRAQIVIGLAVTREGLPVRCWVWPGNTADVTRVAEVKQDLCGWKLGRVVTVLDRGFVSEDNLRELQKGGGHYIIGERMNQGKAIVDEALSRPGRFQKVRENLEVKEIIVGDGEARRRYVLARNPEEAKRQLHQREEMVKRIEAELEGLHRLPKEEHTKAVCRLVAHRSLGRYLKLDKKGWPKLDRAKLKAEAHHDGKYLLLTSDDTLSAQDVALGYKQLLEVEDAFRTLKQTLDLRPVYHRLSHRIRAHVLLCWLALLLIRLTEIRVEQKTGERTTWDRLRRELDRMHLGYFKGRNGQLWRRTDTTPAQRSILTATGVSDPPIIFRIDPKTTQTA